jgi:hypothetical protein
MPVVERLWRGVHGFRWRGAVAAAGGAVTLLFMLWLFPQAAEKSGSAGNRVTDLQQAHTPDAFIAALRKWSATNARAIAIIKQENIRELDFAFPPLYALTLAVTYVTLRRRDRPRRADLVLFTVPFAAAALDYVENGLHLWLLSGIEDATHLEAAVLSQRFDATRVLAAALCADLKSLLLATSLAGVIVAMVKGRRRPGRPGASPRQRDRETARQRGRRRSSASAAETSASFP